MEPTKANAIAALCPNAIWSLTEGKITWDDMKGDSVPSDSDINAKIAALKTDYDSKKYQRDRAIAYDLIQNQLDQLYWDKKNGTNKWVEAIDKVKSDNPKP